MAVIEIYGSSVPIKIVKAFYRMIDRLKKRIAYFITDSFLYEIPSLLVYRTSRILKHFLSITDKTKNCLEKEGYDFICISLYLNFPALISEEPDASRTRISLMVTDMYFNNMIKIMKLCFKI